MRCESARGEGVANDLAVVSDAGREDVVVERVIVAMWWDAARSWDGAVAEEGKAGGDVLGENAEVLAGHEGVRVRVDQVGAEGAAPGPTGDGDTCGVVDGPGELVGVRHFDGGAVRGRLPLADLAYAFLEE